MKAIIFDFDGVIHDTYALAYEIFGSGLSEEEFKDFFNGNFLEREITKEQKTIDEKAYQRQNEAFKYLKIDENIKENLVKLAKDSLLFVVSSNQEDALNTYFQNNKFTNIFTEILGAETHQSKVEKFKYLFEKYNLTVEDCLFVTDTLGDILEANKVGLKTIAVDFGFHERERLEKGNPFKIISKFDEVMEIVNDLEEKKRLSMVKTIVAENKLELLETNFFRSKTNVAKVADAHGNKFILKVGRIDPFQIELFKAAKLIEDQLCFKVPSIIKHGKDWILMEEIGGQFLNEFYNEKADWCLEISKKVSDDYQKVVKELQNFQSDEDLLMLGKRWLFARLDIWSKPIIDEGLIDAKEIEQLKKDFEDMIAKKNADVFGWFHGNVIGDHIVVSGGDVYLLDLAINPRAGKGYYDFLRALDFLFLKCENETEVFNLIPAWMEKYLSEFNKDEIKLVFAFRCIGILGWDILHENVEYVAGDLENKKHLILKLIRREY